MLRGLASYQVTGKVAQCALAGGALAVVLCAGVADSTARAVERGNGAATNAGPTPTTINGIPALMQGVGVGWRAYQFGGRTHPPSRADVPYDKTANEWQAPDKGVGPITADPAHPFYNNAVAADLGVSSTYRVADLNNEAAKNLMTWAVDALKKQNELTLNNKNGETRQARCWEVGVPDIHEAPFEWYFIQTPKEVVIIQGGAMQTVRRIYLNVPHSKNVKPSWYGESVGHYEGDDTLVIDTIGLSDRTFVDGYRTPHTTQLHVVERLKITNDGKMLNASFTADDPGTFYKPWGAKRSRDRVDAPFEEQVCQLNNDDRFSQGFDPIPTADHIDF